MYELFKSKALIPYRKTFQSQPLRPFHTTHGASTLGGSVPPEQGPHVELKRVRANSAGSHRQDGGVGARRRRREQRQTPRRLAHAVRASDTAVRKAGAA